MSAQKRVPCKNCDGKGVVPCPPYKGEVNSCSICHGVGSVLVDIETLEAEKTMEILENKVQSLRADKEALMAENLKLQRKCQEQEANLERLKGRLEMVYLIFGAEGEEYCL